MINNYEGLFIINPELKEDDIKNVSKLIGDSITKNGGSLTKEENWGKRLLAYSIKKFKEGYYYKADFSAPADAIAKLEAAYKLNADILRMMITKR
ncbi:MAG: 30S ribosomal protein S6 [Candidatus Omnitrophica bacterium]|nr:30S ribosomal protein S6 [Candidatus Omnitrophota bacterium]